MTEPDNLHFPHLEPTKRPALSERAFLGIPATIPITGRTTRDGEVVLRGAPPPPGREVNRPTAFPVAGLENLKLVNGVFPLGPLPGCGDASQYAQATMPESVSPELGGVSPSAY